MANMATGLAANAEMCSRKADFRSVLPKAHPASD